MDESVDKSVEERKVTERRWRYRGSLFGPLLLIAIGVLFLLSNTGVIAGDAWEIILRYWPVLLIVIGLDGLLRGEGLVGAVLILAVGVIFLLANLGILAVDVWEVVVRLWPLLLVAVGIDILVGRRSRIGALVGLVILLAVLFAALWALNRGAVAPGSAGSQPVQQPLEGASEAEVNLEMGAGELRLKALSEPGDLIAGTVEARQPDDIVPEFEKRGDRAVYTLRYENGATAFIPGRYNSLTWDLGLAPDVPLDLDVNLGAGDVELDLTGLDIQSLAADFAVGQVTITLPAEGRFSASVNGAIGQIVIVVPRGMEVQVVTSTGISSVNMPDGYEKSDDRYTSPGYDGAENRVELNLNQAMGSVVIREAG